MLEREPAQHPRLVGTLEVRRALLGQGEVHLCVPATDGLALPASIQSLGCEHPDGRQQPEPSRG